MFSTAKQALRELQPTKAIGTMRHIMLWASSSSEDVVYRNPNFQESKEHDETVIYCVHGTADRASAFSMVAKRLLAHPDFPKNISAIICVSFDGRGEGVGIEHFAAQLRDKIRKNKHKNVIVMGHSRGGLVVSFFAENFAHDAGINVVKVFPLCAPFGGSPLAFKFVGAVSESVKEMEADSLFLRILTFKIEQSQTPYVFVVVVDDILVPPTNGFVISPKSTLITLDKHNHLSVLASQRLIDMLISKLKKVPAEVLPEEKKSSVMKP